MSLTIISKEFLIKKWTLALAHFSYQKNGMGLIIQLFRFLPKLATSLNCYYKKLGVNCSNTITNNCKYRKSKIKGLLNFIRYHSRI